MRSARACRSRRGSAARRNLRRWCATSPKHDAERRSHPSRWRVAHGTALTLEETNHDDSGSDRNRGYGAYADGRFSGRLAAASASDLGAVAIRAALERANVPAERIDEIVFGCVLPASSKAPARQAALKAGLPLAAGATTVNKMCGSGMKAAMFAHDLLLAEPAGVAVAGGMESMTNAPYLLPKARARDAHGSRAGARSHVPRRAEDAYEGPPDGHVRRGLRAGVPVHARGAGCVRDRIADARATGDRRRAFRIGDRAGDREGRQDRNGRVDRRTAGQGEARQDPDAEAGVPRRRHGDGRECVVDLGRRGRARDDAPLGSRAAQASRRRP